MLIHGRLVVTPSGYMLDEVKSLLQKALRRQEHELTFQAAKELLTGPRDQLKWQHIVTYMFEDHCLNHPEVFEQLYKLYQKKDKYSAIELISKCYTCRLAACLQVVAINEEHRQYEKFWETDLAEYTEVESLLSTEKGGISADQLLANILRKWREKDTDALISLFGLVNMAAKIENRTVNKAGLAVLLDKTIRKPTMYHLVLSVLFHKTNDEYLRRMIQACFHFASVDDTPQGLILFTTLTHLMYKSKVLGASIPDMHIRSVKWTDVSKLKCMPSWAVDKHTYRGKFGKASDHLFLKRFQHIGLSETELKEFHGERPKADIRTFFDVGCICNNDILEDNPYWIDAKEMYLKQKPSMQKCAKMTKLYYQELLKNKSIVCVVAAYDSSEEDKDKASTDKKRKRKAGDNSSGKFREKVSKLDSCPSSSHEEKDIIGSSKVTTPNGPLLQLPTGSGKVYTRLDLSSMKVFKGPYKSKERQNLCLFQHRAMKEVFNDQHTMEVTEAGEYLAFPLLKSEESEIKIVQREFYDCIAKRQVSKNEGQFVERDSLGIVQLHKLPTADVPKLPLSVWSHFMWRYVLNVGDTGLYNAIATKNLVQIYGIDMEERRSQVKGNDVINMMFGKLPKKEICKKIQIKILSCRDELIRTLSDNTDFEKLREMFRYYRLEDDTDICRNRLEKLKGALISGHV